MGNCSTVQISGLIWEEFCSTHEELVFMGRSRDESGPGKKGAAGEAVFYKLNSQLPGFYTLASH